jgi:F-type H+-transporting ATPase subunit b
MPQIEQLSASWGAQVFWLALVFGLVFLVIGLGMVPKIQGTVDKRDRTVADDLAAASRAREDAHRVEAEWRERDQAVRERAQGVIAEARARAAKATEETLATANAAQAAQVSDSEARIRAASTAATAEIETVAAEAAQEIAARIAGIQVSADEARAAVQGGRAHG